MEEETPFLGLKVQLFLIDVQYFIVLAQLSKHVIILIRLLYSCLTITRVSSVAEVSIVYSEKKYEQSMRVTMYLNMLNETFLVNHLQNFLKEFN